MKKFFKTESGAELLIEKIKGVNVVSIFFAIKTGSNNESNGEEGISHFLEHMLFKGNGEYSTVELTETVENLGGSINAYTSLDETAFYINILKENWVKGLKLLSSMVLNPQFDTAEFENERKVILEELKSGHDNPYKILIDETFKAAFHGHRYSKPIIGTKESLNNLTVTALENYYNSFYKPENILIIVVGDIHIENAAETIESTLQHYTKKRIYNNNISFNREILKSDYPKPRIVKKTVNQNYMNISYRFPGGFFKGFPETHILCTLLGEFKNSFLKEKLKEELQIVTDVTTYFYVLKEHSLFIINTIFPLKISPETVAEKISEEIETLKKRKISYEQIYKAIINHKSDIVYNKESVSSEAKSLLFYEITTGNYGNEEKFLKALEKTDEKKIKSVLKKYFNNPIITVVSPNEKFNIATNVKKINKKKKWSKKKLITLDNGIRIVFEKNSRLPILTFNAISIGGLKFENSEKNGLTYLMGNLLTEGSRNYSKKEINDKFEFYSGAIESFGAVSSFGIQGLILDEFFFDSFKIILDSMLYPEFSEQEIAKKKKYISEKIIAENDDPGTVTIKKFYELLFADSYYRFPVKGTIENLMKFSEKDILNFHKKLTKSENLVFGITGNLTNNHIDFIISELSKIKREEFKFQFEPIEFKGKNKIFKGKLDKNQTHIICGFQAPHLSHKDAAKFNVLEIILGNHSGRLFRQLREELGLCYSTSAFYGKFPEAGAFGIYISTSPENETTAIDKIKEIITELKRKGINNEELVKAKNYIKGRMENSKQKFLNINTKNVYSILYGLGLNYDKIYEKNINDLTVKEVSEAVTDYFDFNNMVCTIFSSEGVD